MKGTQKIQKHNKRKRRVRVAIVASNNRPRVSVFRSNKHIYAQIIDDQKGNTIVSANDLKISKPTGLQKDQTRQSNKSQEPVISEKYLKVKVAEDVGELLAKFASKKKIKKVVFDRSGYKFHGRVKALAEGARKGGLQF